MRTTGLTWTHVFTEAQVPIHGPKHHLPSLFPLSLSSESFCPQSNSTSVHYTNSITCVEFDATPYNISTCVHTHKGAVVCPLVTLAPEGCH